MLSLHSGRVLHTSSTDNDSQPVYKYHCKLKIEARSWEAGTPEPAKLVN
jgi:hypothetical protein